MSHTTTDNMTAETFEYTTADELRELLDDTPHPDEIDEALACLPLDLEAFHARMTAAVASRTAASPAEAVSVVRDAVKACALPGHVIGDEFAALIDRAILTACQLKKAAAEHDRAELLADLKACSANRDADGLAVALGMAPFSIRAYIERLEAVPEADRTRDVQTEALKASALPGTVLDDELACAIVDALSAWSATLAETPEQRAIREAFAEARRLIDQFGEDDPRAFAAIIKAVELQDPGCCDRKLAECGIHLPTPTHCNDKGEGLFSLEQVAEALGADPDDLVPVLEEMEAAGMDVRQKPAGRLQ